MTSHHRIRARNAGLDKVRRVTARVAGGGLVLSGAIAALASATYGGSTHHRTVTYRYPTPARAPATNGTHPGGGAAPLTDPTLPSTTAAVQSTGRAATRTARTANAPAPTTAAPLESPQYPPQTQPYTPPVVVSGGS